MKGFTKIIAVAAVVTAVSAVLLLPSCAPKPTDGSSAPAANSARAIQPKAQYKLFSWCAGGKKTLVLSKTADGNSADVSITGIQNESYVTVYVFDTETGNENSRYMGINEVHTFPITNGSEYVVYIT